ncbi:MAG: glycosyltransferase [Pseudomonadota bacterium]
MSVTSRNAECPCGSGKRYKHCCGAENAAASIQSETPASLRVRALAEHQAGRLVQARELYTQVLDSDPGDVDCLHMLGVLNYQSGHLFEALDQIVGAIEHAPVMTDAMRHNLSLVLGKPLLHGLYEPLANGLPIPSLCRCRLREAWRWLGLMPEDGEPSVDGHAQTGTDKGYSVLVIDVVFPAPDRDAGSVRLVGMFDALLRAGCKVSFYGEQGGDTAGVADRLVASGIEVLNAAYPFLGEALATRGRRYDMVVVCRCPVASEYSHLIRAFCPKALLVFDTVDLHQWREWRQAVLTGDAGLLRQAALTRGQEMGAIHAADVTLVVSDAEQRWLAEQVPGCSVDILSNIHAVRGCKTGFHDRSGLFFLGGFKHAPNVDAVLWFARKIWPLIQARLPEARFYVIGSDMPEEILCLAGAGIVPVGYVADLDPYLDACRLSVAPLRFGAGVKGKINLAQASGVPVVATSIAVEGMHLQPEIDVLVADDPEAFAAAVVRVYEDPDLWSRLSESALTVTREYFSQAAADRAIARLLDRVTKHRLVAADKRSEVSVPRRFLVLPPAGHGSLGDEAMLLGLLAGLRDLPGACEVDVLSIDAETRWPVLPGIRTSVSLLKSAFPPGNAWQEALATLLDRYDAILLLGADMLDGHDSAEVFLERIDIVAAAAGRGLATGILGLSVNARMAPGTVEAFRQLPSSVRLFAREEVSWQRLIGHGIDRAVAVADIAFLMPPLAGPAPFHLEAVEDWLKDERNANRSVMACCLSQPALKAVRGNEPNAEEGLAEVLADLIDSHGVSLLLTGHDLRDNRPGEDDISLAVSLGAALARRLGHVRHHRIAVPSGAAEVKRLMGWVDLALSARMHLAVASLGMGKPVIGLGGQDTFAGVIACFGLGAWFMAWEDFELSALSSLCLEALDVLPEASRQVAVRLPPIVALARSQIGYLTECCQVG